MNRFISFRGKRIDNGKYVYGNLIISDYKYFIRTENGDGEYGNLDMFEVSEDTVGQATGLKDKNGKMIYENDLMIFINEKFIRVFKVVFARGKRAVKTLPDYVNDGFNIIEINGWGFELLYTSEDIEKTGVKDVLFPNISDNVPDYSRMEIIREA